MRSASCYTDLRRVTAYAKNTKVQYPGSIAKNWEVLQAALPCNPNFAIQNYVGVPIWCSQTNACATLVPNQTPPVYSGGNAQTESPTILSGGNEGTESTTILSGGNA